MRLIPRSTGARVGLTFAVAVSSGLLLLYVATPSFAPAISAEIRSLPRLLSAVFGRVG